MFDKIDYTLILDLFIIIYHLCSLRGRGGGEGSSQIIRTTMDEVKKKLLMKCSGVNDEGVVIIFQEIRIKSHLPFLQHKKDESSTINYLV